jgi:hypothetical protein
MPTQPVKRPADRKPKIKPFTFTGADGKQHTLPPVSKGKGALTGRDLREATLGGVDGQLAYMFKVLEGAKPPAATLDAIYGLSQDAMMNVLGEWGEHGDGDGASLGESTA